MEGTLDPSAAAGPLESGFNGATTERRSWKAWLGRRVKADLERAARLQWGHDEGVVEGQPLTISITTAGEASMGPRRRSRGRRESFPDQGSFMRSAEASIGPRRRSRGSAEGRARPAARRATAWLSLQLGHDERSRRRRRSFSEARTGWFGTLAVSLLQLGHDEGVVEGGLARAPRESCRVKLNWANDEGVVEGLSSRACGPLLAGERFNWATTKESWKSDQGMDGGSFTGSIGVNWATTMKESWKAWASATQRASGYPGFDYQGHDAGVAGEQPWC